MNKTAAILSALLLFGVPGPGWTKAKGDPAKEAYEAARRSYYALKDDAARRKLRHNWLNVAAQFQAVAKRYPTSERAPDALYTAGELLMDLGRISMLQEDLDAAIADYTRIVEKYPKDNLADDAAVAVARIHIERTGETDKARAIVHKALGALPRGDKHGQLLALQKTLPVRQAPRATGKTIGARAPATGPLPSGKVATAGAVARDQQDPKNARAGTIADAFARAAAMPPSNTSVPEAHAEQDALDSQAAAEPGALVASANPAPSKRGVTRLQTAVDAAPIDEATLAEQLGLKVRRVVIDAGHGGHDTGAIGRKGTREKDVTLAISKRVAEMLADQGLEVVLTRDDDTFVRLEDRTRIANEAKGDLFLSIHCNASESRKIRGIETYTLNVASDRYSIRLAARENASSEKSISDLQFILADLATKANTEESQRLAKQVQRSMVQHLRPTYAQVKDLGTKQALFFVLLGARMPAILVETAFISHAEEEKRLASKAYQEDVARAIADGVQTFLTERERFARID